MICQECYGSGTSEIDRSQRGGTCGYEQAAHEATESRVFKCEECGGSGVTEPAEEDVQALVACAMLTGDTLAEVLRNVLFDVMDADATVVEEMIAKRIKGQR